MRLTLTLTFAFAFAACAPAMMVAATPPLASAQFPLWCYDSSPDGKLLGRFDDPGNFAPPPGAVVCYDAGQEAFWLGDNKPGQKGNQQ